MRTASGLRNGIELKLAPHNQADGSVRVEFNSSGDTAAAPTPIDRISARYNQRMGR